MNFKSIGLGIAATAAMTAVSAPAEAFSLAGSNFSLIAPVTISQPSSGSYNLDFGPGTAISMPGSPFINGDSFTIADLSGLSPNSFLGSIDNFFSGIDTTGGVFDFDATSIFFGVSSNGAAGEFYDLIVDGVFVGPGGELTPGFGTVTSQLAVALGSGQTRTTGASADFKAVPTPALVPAALGFGAAMLRKRKGEKAEKEAAGVKA